MSEQQGLDVCAEWVFEDEGFSGATLVRPGLEALRDLVAQMPVEVVLCYAPDRLARLYTWQALLIEEFARAGTEVRFAPPCGACCATPPTPAARRAAKPPSRTDSGRSPTRT